MSSDTVKSSQIKNSINLTLFEYSTFQGWKRFEPERGCPYIQIVEEDEDAWRDVGPVKTGSMPAACWPQFPYPKQCPLSGEL